MKHFKSPQGFSPLPAGAPCAERDNPACGDSFKLSLDISDSRIAGVHIEGQGCAVSTASCSIMAERLINMTLPDARFMAQKFITAVKDRNQKLPESDWGELAAFESVKNYRGRVTCTVLCWEILLELLKQIQPEEQSI